MASVNISDPPNSVKENAMTQILNYKQEIRERFALIRNELIAVENEKLEKLDEIISKINNSESPDFYLDARNITLSWNEEGFKQFIANICTFESSPIPNIKDQLWSSAKRGSGIDNIFRPHGLTIDAETDDIYIADCYNCRIQVFSGEGLHKRSISHPELLNPHRILCMCQHLYITDPINKQVVKINKLTDEMEHSEQLEYTPGGLDVFKQHTYILDFIELRIYIYDEEFYKDDVINLKIPVESATTSEDSEQLHLLDLKMREKHFFILLENSFYKIILFDFTGDLLHCLVPSSLVTKAFYFCVDNQENILISSWEDNQILVFSRFGTAKCRIGNSMKGEKDCLIHPRGVAILTTGALVVCDNKDSTCLHCYNYL